MFIDDADPGYATAVQEIANEMASRRCIPFLGAGISRECPSCLPLANDLIEPLRRALWQSVAPLISDQAMRPAGLREAEDVVMAAPLERLLSVVQETHGRGAVERYLAVLDRTEWNANHAALASIAARGALPAVITLNFDLLIEEAIKDHGGASISECPLAPYGTGPIRIGSSESPTAVVKPHGSIAPLGHAGGKFDLLGATIEDVGNHPDPRNVGRIAPLLSAHPVLLVAGYSDDDWDIFPILRRAATTLAHVYWVFFASDDDVACRIPPSGGRVQKVTDWLRNSRVASTVLVGRSSKLLTDVARQIGTRPRSPHPRPTTAVLLPDANFLLGSGPDDPVRIRTAVSLAILLQNRGPFNDRLLAWLQGQSAVRADPILQARVHLVEAHTAHTRRHLPRAMRHMRRCISLKTDGGTRFDDRVTDDLVWLGYEHFCLAKRSCMRAPFALFRAGHHARRGHALMLHALRLARRDHPKSRRRPFTRASRLGALVRYYHADLKHSRWEHLLLLGPRARQRLRRPFQNVLRSYEKIARRYGTLMDWEYYWLRALEARVLAGLASSDGLAAHEQQITEIEETYGQLQNHVQAGNTRVYRALLRWTHGARTDELERLLSEAEGQWYGVGRNVPSGLLRIAFYRRFFGLGGVWRTLGRAMLAGARAQTSDSR